MTPVERILPYALAFGVTLVMIWALVPVARRIGLVDYPSSRKHHEGRVPLVGGMAMFCGFAFAVLAPETTLGPKRAMLAGSLLLIIAGVLDDFRELSARSRLVAQLASGLLMALWGGVVLQDVGHLLFQDRLIPLGPMAIPFTLFAVVGGINALNMSDGLDGLAGGLALVVLVPLWILTGIGEATGLLPLIGIAACCVFAFWLANMRFPWQSRARVFMGDSGSMFLGFLIAWFLTDLTQSPGRMLAPVTALYLFAIPLMDTVFVMFRRVGKRRSPFVADRMHLHHLLVDLGFQVGTATTLILTVAAILAGVGLGGRAAGIPENLMFALFLALFGLYCCAGILLRRRIESRARP